jgi:hypothetical protein
MTAMHTAIFICSLAALVACAAKNDPLVSLRTLHQSPYCGSEAAGLRWLTANELTEILRNGPSGVHLGAAPAPNLTATDDDKLLLLSLGQKNSGGYGLGLTSSQVRVQDQAIQLPVEIQEPEPGSMQTMQLTQPCLVVGLGNGGYSKVSAGVLGSLAVDD